MTALLPESQTVLRKLDIQPATVGRISSHVRRSTYLAVLQYLTQYQAKLNDSNRKKVHGYVEAFNIGR